MVKKKRKQKTPRGKFTIRIWGSMWNIKARKTHRHRRRRARARDKLTYQRGHFRRGSSSRTRWPSATVYTDDRYVTVSRQAHVSFFSLFFSYWRDRLSAISAAPSSSAHGDTRGRMSSNLYRVCRETKRDEIRALLLPDAKERSAKII